MYITRLRFMSIYIHALYIILYKIYALTYTYIMYVYRCRICHSSLPTISELHKGHNYDLHRAPYIP